MNLEALFEGIPTLEKIHWDPSRTFKKITSDSRLVEPGDVFVACAGARMDGHDFLGQAIVAKAAVIVFDKNPEIPVPNRVVAIRVPQSQATFAELLKRFYQNPTKGMRLIGITGTNGKTTTAYTLYRLLKLKAPAAYIGTIGYELPSQEMTALNTTPGPEILFPLFQTMQENQVRFCVMEVSSHALDQRRVHGLEFDLGIFTQLTQDHLDYHITMERYFQAKRRFFSEEPAPRHMLINRDCAYGARLLEEFMLAKSYSLNGAADFQAQNIRCSLEGSDFIFKGINRTRDAHIPFLMRHNVSNLLAVMGALEILGFAPEDFLDAIRTLPGVPGRLERVREGQDFEVLVDYAHTPDAFENVLGRARELNPKRVLTLFGCGGDRDREKRPLMAQIACHYSDFVILTSDNPRSEDPEAIIKDMERGIHADDRSRIHIGKEIDRRRAIERVLDLAQPGDIVFILGKGHEDYQILGDKKNPFDDRLVVRECLKRKSRVFLS